MILLIDNFDSFTYNIYQYVAERGYDVDVARNNALTIEQIRKLKPDAILISPGPGLPKDAGNCTAIVKAFYQQIPILGICLGHQVIGEALGAQIRPARQIMHGKTSFITHQGTGIFQYISQPLEVMRYHSYVIDIPLSAPLEVTATSMDDQEIMAVQHTVYPVYGVQFHPESIGTGMGKKLIHQFLTHVREGKTYESLS
ncbi:anthranilate synthase component II [Virgibacillus pantothenticus]|uniref:Anthranilate synthase subunit II n=1 Tax=Virgibacillus pantothenticus TaxID=1473 RepID=A0A0L0QK03_VIRPA|nr:aminodeoxychorismate/anthranilate synthase component II [Virgibacillus pantothenticus]KNE18891.1 anthranilate synthase subunit II [Virgibacillus pantothenticus]MBU8565180.1 aminodeoxychorismate/anthranilate synthase component II [Virgibacillus pantothenticus]MBU8601464.1 aminodeoxychorismate/anthranilate synthase component II [Virgibacillus pantothenticus]MBU8633499.1 aminodeoxychorismate/anthranilate synthase component II [Virgibacillus pantothenticus]MBU8643407.1 aminodeoxychorismate/anth